MGRDPKRGGAHGAIVALAVLGVTAGCAEPENPNSCEESWRCSIPATPSVPVPEDDELPDSFTEYSGLTIPESATDVDITADHGDTNELYYKVTFTVGRDGFEEFCEAAGIDVEDSPGPPDAETRDTYDIPEDADTVDGSAECHDSHPENDRVKRNAVAVFPEDDTASVFVNVVKWPRD